MLLTEQHLQRAVAQYCQENRDAILAGQLTEANIFRRVADAVNGYLDGGSQPYSKLEKQILKERLDKIITRMRFAVTGLEYVYNPSNTHYMRQRASHSYQGDIFTATHELNDFYIEVMPRLGCQQPSEVFPALGVDVSALLRLPAVLNWYQPTITKALTQVDRGRPKYQPIQEEAAAEDDILKEGIVDGVRSIFGPGSAAQGAAASLMQKGADALAQARGAVQQAGQQVGDAFTKVRNDYTVGAASGELRKLAEKRNQAEVAFNQKLEAYKADIAQLQAERRELRAEQKKIRRGFHRQQHDQYVRAAQALGIRVTRSYAFYDEVDQQLELRGLVPQVNLA